MQVNAIYADHEQIKIQHGADVLRHIPFMCVTTSGCYDWYKFAVCVTAAQDVKRTMIVGTTYTRDSRNKWFSFHATSNKGHEFFHS